MERVGQVAASLIFAVVSASVGVYMWLAANAWNDVFIEVVAWLLFLFALGFAGAAVWFVLKQPQEHPNMQSAPRKGCGLRSADSRVVDADMSNLEARAVLDRAYRQSYERNPEQEGP